MWMTAIESKEKKIIIDLSLIFFISYEQMSNLYMSNVSFVTTNSIISWHVGWVVVTEYITYLFSHDKVKENFCIYRAINVKVLDL